MKLVSRFKDYYDALRAMDRDPDPVYVREQRVLPVAAMTEAQRAEADRLWSPLVLPPQLAYGVERSVVGFCGRLFPMYIVGPDVCWDHAHLVEALEREARGDIEERGYWLPPWRQLQQNLRVLEREWALLQRRIDDGPFLAFRAPVLWRREHELVVNPILRALQFASRVDAYTAWQELSMFLGNNMVAATAVAPRPISDELKAQAKGFDPKTSFKNQKNRKKANRSDWE